ncbi:MAG: hypothetical protein ABI325_00885 [Ginsengibacter sp.]
MELINQESERVAKNLISEVYFFDNRNIPEKEIIREVAKISGKIKSDIDSLGEDYDTPEAIILDNTPLSQYIASLRCAKWLQKILTASFTAEYGM